MKEKVGKLSFTKIENFWSMKDPVKKMKRKATGLEKISVSHIPSKGLVSRTYKQLFKVNNKKTIQLENMQKILPYHQRRHANDKHMKRYSIIISH